VKPDEQRFLIDIFKKCGINRWNITVREIIESPGFYIYPKRAEYILRKWCEKGWYEYGTSIYSGWLEPAGKIKALELIKAGDQP